MSRHQRPPCMRFFPRLVWDAQAMALDGAEARRDASHWYVRLREEEHDEALKAEFLFARDREYVVEGDQVIIIDEFTGRKMPGQIKIEIILDAL